MAASMGGAGWMGCTAEIPQLDRTLNRCVSQIRSQIRLVWLPCQPWDRCSQRQHWTGLKPKLAHRTVLSTRLRKAGLGRWIPGGLTSFSMHGAHALDGVIPPALSAPGKLGKQNWATVHEMPQYLKGAPWSSSSPTALTRASGEGLT